MARVFRVSSPPRVDDPELNRWFRQVMQALNEMPAMSMISNADGPESVVTAEIGAIVINVGSSATTRAWIKESGNTSSGWTEMQ